MDTKTYDWKDVANSQFDKAFALALLILLFGIMVTPKVDIKSQKFTVEEMLAIDLPPEEREKLKPPEDLVKPVIDIVFDVSLKGDDPTDPDYLKKIQESFDPNMWNSEITGGNDRPFIFTPYEDPPVPINPVAPIYPPFAIGTGIQGTVVLEVDVYRDGTLGIIKVKRSLMKGAGGLDEAAISAVKKWKFQPGKSGGKAVDTSVIIPIEFTLTK